MANPRNTNKKPPKLPRPPMRRTDPSKGEGPNWRGVVLFLGMAALLLLAFYAHQNQTAASTRELGFGEFDPCSKY